VNEFRSNGQVVQFGQRTLATIPVFVQYNRSDNTALINLGGSTAIPKDQNFAIQIGISLAIVLLLFVMLVYLIHLRRNRMLAEKWL